MTTTSSIDEVVERLADTAAALMLLRFRSANLPLALTARLEARHPELRFHVLAYQAAAEEFAPGSAIEVVRHCAELAAKEPPPALLLFPRYPEDGTLSPEAAIRFWKHLNGQRELLGSLAARVLLGVDPRHEPYAVAYAKDLLSWCAPKYSLPLDAPRDEVRALEFARLRESLSSSSDPSTDENLLTWHTLWPLWQEIAAARTVLTSADAEQIGIPLLAAALTIGRLRDAADLERGVSTVALSSEGARGVFSRLRGELAQIQGRYDEAAGFYEHALEVHESLLQSDPQNQSYKRQLSITMGAWVEFLQERGRPGDAERVLPLLERELRLDQQRLRANPESAQAARDVSVSLNKLADFLARRGLPGDAEQALSHYERSLELSERLLEANPESAQAARDVSVSLERLGDFLAMRGHPGDAKQALSHYKRSLEVREHLLEANPESSQTARDVSVGLLKLGDFLARRGLPDDAEQALSHFGRSLEVSERLLEANPESSQAARDVSVMLERLGGFLSRRGLPGDAERALSLYGRGLNVRERLLEVNTESAQAARDLSVSLLNLADFLARRGLPGDAEHAQRHYERSLEFLERLLKANPESAQAARDVSLSLERLSRHHARAGRPESEVMALQYQQRAAEIATQLYERGSGTWFVVRDYIVAQHLLAQRALAAERQDLFLNASRACHQALREAARQGIEMDAPMRDLLQQLERESPPSEG